MWFGKSWGAPCCEDEEHIPTPVGESCARCREPILASDSGISSPLVEGVDWTGVKWRLIHYHVGCFLKGIQPHGPECPHCRGLEPRDHAPGCSRGETGLGDCRPMPEGKQ